VNSTVIYKTPRDFVTVARHNAPASSTLGHEVAFFDEFLQAQLHGAGFAFRERHDPAEGEAFVFGEEATIFFASGWRSSERVSSRAIFWASAVFILRKKAEDEDKEEEKSQKVMTRCISKTRPVFRPSALWGFGGW